MSGIAFYLRDCLTLGISEKQVVAEIVPSKRSFPFGNTVFNSLGVAPSLFIAED